MLVLLSPAKKLDFEYPAITQKTSQIAFAQETAELVDQLKSMTPSEFKSLMGISMNLAELNIERYLQFDTHHYTLENGKQALFAFMGDVYRSFDAATLDEVGIAFAQEHLGILSGLYGLLRPLDVMQPYRLEMGTSLQTDQGKNLYEFWGNKITQLINDRLAGHANKTVINLASQEYAKAVNVKVLESSWLTIDFKEHRNGKYQTIGILAKRARGLMARYIIDQKLENPEDLKAFDIEDYQFNPNLSDANKWVFSR